MGYVLRVRFASFFAGAAVASAVGLYVLHKDYEAAHQAISRQFQDGEDVVHYIMMAGLYESLDERISALENLKKVEAARQVDAAE